MRSDAFRHAVESKDLTGAADLFTEDVTFRSPVVYKPYEGRDALLVILGAVERVFSEFRYADQVETDAVAVLHFEANVGDRAVEGVDILRFAPEDRIAELTVMVRPMSGMHAMAERMQAMLEDAA